MKESFAADLKTIYPATDEKKALAALDRVTEKWTLKYPNSMKRWKDNWDAISPIFKFSSDVRKVIYTTNAIESLNPQKDGLPPSGTGVRSTVNGVLCMKDGFQNKKNSLVKTGGKAACY